MIGISSIGGVTASDPSSQYQASSPNRFFQDLQAIGAALKSGNLSSAQSNLGRLEQDLPGGASSSQLFGGNAPANTAFQNLISALQSNNLSGAQSAFSSLQSALKPAPQSHGGHHHHGASALAAPVSSLTTSAGTSVGPGLNVVA